MCGSKGSAPTPSSASTTTAGSSSGQSATNFAQGPSPATGQRYEDFLNKVTSLATTPFDPSTQSNVAPLNTFQNQGLNQMFNLGMTMGNFEPAKIQEIMSPYIQDVVKTSQDWFNNQNKIQGNNLISQGIRSGNAFGGDRAGIAEAELAGQQQLAQAPVIAGLYQSGYGQALNEYNQLKQFGIQGAEEAVKAGTVQQAQAQRELDVATANALQRSGYPFQVANWEGAALGGIGPLTGTVGQATTTSSANTSGVSNPPTPNPLTQAIGVGSSLVGLGTSLNLNQPSAGGKDGGRIGPQGFAYGGNIDNFEDETNYAGYGYDSGGSGGDKQDDSSKDEKEDKKDDEDKPFDVVEAAQKVGDQKPDAPKPPPSITGKFEIKRKAQPYIGVRVPGYGVPASIPQTGGTPQAPASGGSSFGTTAGRLAGSALGSAFGPVGTLLGGAAGGAFGGLFGKDGGIVPHMEAGGTFDEGDTGNTPDTLDQGDPAVSEPSLKMVSMQSIPPARPIPPTPDPLARYLGTEGPRSVTGPPRGSPAGGLPVQARDAPNLMLTRERIQRELEDNPRLAARFDANTTAEIGTRPRKRFEYQPTVIDRAVQEGKPLGALVNNPNYYPPATTRSAATSGQDVNNAIWAGANPVNFATGNASFDPKTGRWVGFAGGPQTAVSGSGRSAELYGIEGQSGLPYARAVGYQGPSRTGIGPAEAIQASYRRPDDTGGNATDDSLEVSAQRRQGPPAEPPAQRPQQPGGFGYSTQRIPELGTPPRDFGQRWAVNPFTQAGIAMLRSQSPYFATGLGEGLAGAAGAIEHTRAEQVLDSKPVLRTEFPTLTFQKGDGTFVHTDIPNPAYDAKKVPRDRLEYEKTKMAKEKWKPTGMIENGRVVLYDESTGQTKLGQRIDDEGKPVPTTVAPAPTPTTTEPGKTTASWMPNLNPSPDDPLIKDVIPPDQGPQTKKQIEDRGKANIKTLDKAREQHEAANQQIGRMNQMETALNALPRTGFMSPGYLAGYNATIASAINHAARMIGAPEQFTPNDVANMEEANKIKTLGGFLQSRLTGGGQHNAASIIQASLRAYPGAENSPQGAALIIAANREVSQRDRDYYEFITKYGNTTFRGDLNAATLAFDRLAPMEKYIERARAKVEARFGPNPAVAPTTQQPRMEGENKRALDWANSNPNDPRSAEIKRRLGVQ